MIELLEKYISYKLAIIVSITMPIFMVLYSTWIKWRYDKKLEKERIHFQKELQKHQIRLNHYKDFYKKIDEIQKEIKLHSDSISEEITQKTIELSKTHSIGETLDYKNYLGNVEKINQLMIDSIQKIQKEANEFRFYASDRINILIDRLDTFYSAYIGLLLNQDFRLLQDAFDFILKGDFTGLLSFMQNP